MDLCYVDDLVLSLVRSDKDKWHVRRLIAQVANLANVNVSKQTEEQLVKAILNNKIPKDINDLANMMK